MDKSQQDAAVAATQANYDSTMNDPAASEVAKQAADSELRQAKSTRDSVLLKDSQAVQNAENHVAAAKVQVSSAKASAAVDNQGPTSGALASANAQVETAQVQVDAAQQALDETTLRAPAPGTVTSLTGAVGQSSTSAGASASTDTTSTAGDFVVITDMTALEVDTMVSEADAKASGQSQSLPRATVRPSPALRRPGHRPGARPPPARMSGRLASPSTRTQARRRTCS